MQALEQVVDLLPRILLDEQLNFIDFGHRLLGVVRTHEVLDQVLVGQDCLGGGGLLEHQHADHGYCFVGEVDALGAESGLGVADQLLQVGLDLVVGGGGDGVRVLLDDFVHQPEHDFSQGFALGLLADVRQQ